MRWITSLIALALGVILVGCGSDSGADEPTEADKEQAQTAVESYVRAWQDGDATALCDIAVWGTDPLDEIEDPSEDLSDELEEFRSTCADNPDAFQDFVEQPIGKIRSFEIGEAHLEGESGSVDVSMVVRAGGERRETEFRQAVVKIDDQWLAYSQDPAS